MASSKDDPDYLAGVISNALVYGKEHPYGETMTEETVENVNLEDIKEYYRTYFKPNIAYLAIVGDITDKEAKNLVNDYFSSWEKGKYPHLITKNLSFRQRIRWPFWTDPLLFSQ